ncbi:MAG: hypothetical protein O2840_02705 [bacterium]|nr:hypothetical protein [bacterium]
MRFSEEEQRELKGYLPDFASSGIGPIDARKILNDLELKGDISGGSKRLTMDEKARVIHLLEKLRATLEGTQDLIQKIKRTPLGKNAKKEDRRRGRYMTNARENGTKGHSGFDFHNSLRNKRSRS